MRRSKPLLWFTLLTVLLHPIPAGADSQTVHTTGTYTMGDRDSRSDARKMALVEAKRLALEEAGTYVQASSTVRDFELSHDEVNTLTAGTMRAKVTDEKWRMEGDSMIVTVTIEAVIDMANLDDKARTIRESEGGGGDIGDLQAELDALKKELAALKKQQAGAAVKRASESTERAGEERAIVEQVLVTSSLQSSHAALRTGDPARAAEEAGNALERAPGNYKAALLLAQAKELQGDLVAAEAGARQAIDLAPNVAKTHAVHGKILLKMRRHRDAFQAFDAAVQKNPKCGWCYFGRGRSRAKLQQHPRKVYRDMKTACRLGFQKGCRAKKKMEKRAAKRAASNQ
jgi:TolA-binding protein